MALHFKHNLYRGVNAHLHSYYQAHGDWSSFHTGHITDLARAISQLIPAGYAVNLDKSLQLREYHPDTGEKIYRPEPDVTIYQQTASTAHGKSGASAATLELPLLETLAPEDEIYYSAIRIYEAAYDTRWGKPIVQIELLSPTNKPMAGGYIQYQEKRNRALKSGLVMVEIDYLHETASPIRGIPNYRHHQPNATPYSIAISNPNPSLEEGQVQVTGFHVDQPIPQISIPLAGTDHFMMTFDEVYQQTFSSFPAYWQTADYSQLPENFDRYTEADQERIRAVMERAKLEAAKES